MRVNYIILLFVILPFSSGAQDSSSAERKFTISGYLKDMESLRFDKDFRNLVSYNLIHNRLNAKWKLNSKFMMAAELRSRMYWGEEVSQTPGFVQMLSNSGDAFDWQKVWIEKNNLVFLTNVERLYADYNSGRWNLRAGRQRVNWGINMIWNPNDIFNTYNFLDFDYEERPGADAVKILCRTGDLSNAELVYSMNAEKEKIAALRYFFNKWGYDIQLITGWYHDHVTAGAGWAGNIGQAGLKGEAQYFFRSKDSGDHFNMAVEVSHLLQKGWFINGSLMLNSNGMVQPVSNIKELGFAVSPERIMPGKWSLLAGLQKEFTPLFSGNINLVYSPGVDLFIIFPSLSYSLSGDLDADLIWQSYFLKLDNQFQGVSHQGFLRLKWSF